MKRAWSALAALLVAPGGPFRAAEDPAARGPASAPLVIEEFSDFLCPFSRQASRTLSEVLEAYPGRARWVSRSFPLAIHRPARAIHEAALAAGEWGKYWEMRERILAAETPPDRAALLEMAAAVGIPRDELEAALDSRAYAAEVDRDIAEGRRRGVEGTPTWFFNGRRVTGSQPREVYEYFVRRALGLEAALPEGIDLPTFLEDPEAGHPAAAGPLDAPRVVKVFLDLRSPLLEKAAPVLREMLARHSARTRFVLRARPTGIYEDSLLAHQAALALSRRGVSFLDAAEHLSRLPGRLDASQAIRWARRLGLDEAAGAEVRRELEEGRDRRRVEDEMALAQRLGVKGSPSLLSPGVREDGVEGLRRFLRHLDSHAGDSPPADLAKADPVSDRTGGGAPLAPRCDEHPGAVAGPPAAAPSPADASLPTVRYDLGLLAAGASLAHRFDVRNDGPQAVRFTGARASTNLDVREVPLELTPGGSRPLDVVFHPGAAPGKVEGSCTLATSGGKSIRFLVAGSVSDEIEVRPAGSLHLLGIEGDGARAEAEIRFRDGASTPPRIARVEPEGIEARLVEVEAGRRWRLEVMAPRGRAAGTEAGRIEIETGFPRIPKLGLGLEVLIQPEVIASPAQLVLDPGAASSGGAAREKMAVRLRSARRLPFAVASVRSDLPFLEVEPSRTSAEVDHRLLVRFDPARIPLAGAAGEIIVTVAFADAPDAAATTRREVRVPVIAAPR